MASAVFARTAPLPQAQDIVHFWSLSVETWSFLVETFPCQHSVY